MQMRLRVDGVLIDRALSLHHARPSALTFGNLGVMPVPEVRPEQPHINEPQQRQQRKTAAVHCKILCIPSACEACGQQFVRK